MTLQKMRPIRLLLVDDHELVRVGLRTVLDRTGSIEVAGEAGTMATAVAEAMRLKPDVILMDVRLPDGSGVEACREIRAACPEIRIIFLTSFADEYAVLATFSAGAEGYLLKEIGSPALIHAIEVVAGGGTILDPAVTQPVLTRLRTFGAPLGKPRNEALSPQEQRVLALVSEGHTNKEIAAALSLSDKTVKNYLSNIYQKLQVGRRSQAAAMYVRMSQGKHTGPER